MPVSRLLIPTIALICGYVLIRYTDRVTIFLNRVGGLVISPRKVHSWIFRVCGAMDGRRGTHRSCSSALVTISDSPELTLLDFCSGSCLKVLAVSSRGLASAARPQNDTLQFLCTRFLLAISGLITNIAG